MTEEIKSKIDDQADKYGFQVPYNGTNDFYNEDKVKGFQDGATFGYQLAEQEINEWRKEATAAAQLRNDHLEEIERLKGLVEDAYWAGQGQATETLMIGAGNDSYKNDKAKTLSRFKTDNNL